MIFSNMKQDDLFVIVFVLASIVEVEEDQNQFIKIYSRI